MDNPSVEDLDTIAQERRVAERRILIGVMACDKRREQTAAQRETWLKDVVGADVMFFLGRQDRDPLPDEVFLDVLDDYDSLPAKARAISRWTLEQSCYDWLLKLDDDTVLFPGRMPDPRLSGKRWPDYSGWKQSPQGSHSFCAGMAYWLSRRAMSVIAQAEFNEETAEDRWTGKALLDAGIRAESCPKIQWFGKVASRGDLPGNTKARLSSSWVAGEFSAKELRHAYFY